jgi:hypothetical protein
LLAQAAERENTRQQFERMRAAACGRRISDRMTFGKPIMQAGQDEIAHAGEAPIAGEPPIMVEAFYRYGYKGREMLAIRAPFAMSADGAEIIGRLIESDEKRYVVASIARQISGPIHHGEPFGVELRAGDAREEPVV